MKFITGIVIGSLLTLICVSGYRFLFGPVDIPRDHVAVVLTRDKDVEIEKISLIHEGDTLIIRNTVPEIFMLSFPQMGEGTFGLNCYLKDGAQLRTGSYIENGYRPQVKVTRDSIYFTKYW